MYPFPQLLLIFSSIVADSGDNNHQLIWMGFKLAVKSKRKITYTKVNRVPSAETVSALFKELLQITGLTKSDYADLTAELTGVETVREASVKTWLYNGVLPSKGSRKTVLRMFELLCDGELAAQWSQAFIDLEIKAKRQRKRNTRRPSHAEVIPDDSSTENSHTVTSEELSRKEPVDDKVVRRKWSLPVVKLAERAGRPYRMGGVLIVAALFTASVLLFLASAINRVTIVNEIVLADCNADLSDSRQRGALEYSVRVIRNNVLAGEHADNALPDNQVIEGYHSPDTCHLVVSQQKEQGVKIQLPPQQRQLVNSKLSREQR
ncbi:hypothetical protein [Vibrio sp. SCSIO 43137]|uniref:hypothetical protein n=1 Tax=Vibrio sp. SCSIO 43137 TaxID=3021011 RepID=UPI00230756B8|nr:hypothetical protein [Vibrio sp. SCSIO 43137]WCE32036.1 hypothetical protein PK654_16140 [Vibrio sp. SCSIO 43137]